MKKNSSFIIICGVMLLPGLLKAQWELRAQNIIDNSGIYYGTIYAKDGIAWAGRDALWMSADTGSTWSRRGPALKNDELIADIRFFDSNIGIFGTTYGNVYQTQDRGLSWKIIKRYQSLIAVTLCYAGSANDIVIGVCNAGGAVGNLSVTHDGGANWRDSIQLQDYIEYLYESPGGDIYTMAGRIYPRSMHLEISTDRGDTWKEQPGKVDPDCFSFVADECTVVASNEAYAYSYDLEADVFRTTDKGATWQSPAKFQKAVLTGCISAAGDGLFMQSVDGVLRSTDRGVTWTELSGPGAGWDSRYVTAFDNNIILAVDAKGSIYRTFNAGADSLVIKPGGFSTTRFSSARIINDSSNITIHLPIYFHRSGTMGDVDMIMHYPTLALNFKNATLYNGKSFDVAGSAWPGRVALHIPAADLNAAPDSLLGYVNFLWTPFEFDCDQIVFDSVDTHTEGPCSGPSQALPFKGIIGSFQTCGLSGVAENQRNPDPPNFSIYPNPARSSIQVALVNTEGKMQYELFDELGIARKNGIISENTFTIDLANLAEGNYYLRIGGNGEAVATKRVVVVK